MHVSEVRMELKSRNESRDLFQGNRRLNYRGFPTKPKLC